MKMTYLFTLVLVCSINLPAKNIDSLFHEYENKINNQAIEIETLKVKQESYNDTIDVILTILGVVLVIGTVFSLVTSFISERRETKIFKITLDNYEEAKHNSIARAENENWVLKESKTTLQLVNDTLSLATAASRRTSQSLANKLRKSIQHFEKEATTLIIDSGAFDDDKYLTIDPSRCNDMHVLARKIAVIETNLMILDESYLDNPNNLNNEKNLELQPYCNFIQGTESYLKDQYNEAINYWEIVISQKEAEDRLKSLAHFWIGYVNNNLGAFEKAKKNFVEAQKLATDSRKFELLRIQYETKFFNKDSVEEIVNQFELLLIAIDDYKEETTYGIIKQRKNKVLTTLGNIYYELGNETIDKEVAKLYYVKSHDIFAGLLEIDTNKDIFHQIKSIPIEKQRKLIWTIFGYIESLYKIDSLNNYNIVEKLYVNIMYDLAHNEYWNREEKRTKVLAKTTQLICTVRCKKDQTTIDNEKNQVENLLRDVEKRLTIYSQIQRRNVDNQTFRDDLEKIVSNKM